MGGTYGKSHQFTYMSNSKHMEVLEIFSPSLASMRTVPLNKSARRWGAAGAVLGRSIYMCGGAMSYGPESSCVRLDKDDSGNVTYQMVCLKAVNQVERRTRTHTHTHTHTHRKRGGEVYKHEIFIKSLNSHLLVWIQARILLTSVLFSTGRIECLTCPGHMFACADAMHTVWKPQERKKTATLTTLSNNSLVALCFCRVM